MRSPKEIRFRLSQELANIRLLLSPPRLPEKVAHGFPQNLPPVTLPVEGAALIALADQLLQHRFPLLGHELETGPEIRWRRDYVQGIEGGLEYFRRVPYLDAAKAGDHKIIWELNRHQHLVVLARAWQVTGRREYLEEIAAQLRSWLEQNPCMRGINWASALEVAFRALSWLRLLQLAGEELPADLRRTLLTELFRHGVYLRHNLSVYFSPNTHLLGEAVVLHALGVAFPEWPQSAAWRALGARVVNEEMENQVRSDGSHFEQSSAYHVYTVDMFALHAQLAGKVAAAYRDKLQRMVRYLAALTPEDGYLPLLGDDDGGSLVYPYGPQRTFGRTALAGSGPGEAPVLFPDAGVAVLSRSPAHIVVDTKAFGYAGAGHSHAHALSVVCRYQGCDVLADPGTYTYVGEPEWRTKFRGTAFHNTLRIDGLDQAAGSGPFRWMEKPETGVLCWLPQEEFVYLHAECRYRGLRHERHFLWLKADEALAVVDVVSGDSGVHLLEQFWHVSDPSVLVLPEGTQAQQEQDWRSETPGAKFPGIVIRVPLETKLPAVLGAMIHPGGGAGCKIRIEVEGDAILLHRNGGHFLRFPMTANGLRPAG